MGKIPDLVSTENVREILELSNSMVMSDMITPVKKALDMFENNISRLIFLPDVPRLEMRLKTVQIIFESISNELKGKQHRHFLRSTGKTVGRSLGVEMVEFLMRHNKLPRDYEVFIKLWNEWDMIAGWGRRSYSINNNSIILDVDENFLTSGGWEDKHMNCPFLEGYMQGVLWEVMKEHYRWFKRALTRPGNPPLQPIAVEEKIGEGKCRFIVKLGEEELQNAFDMFYEARDSERENDFNQATRDIRASVEMAFKEKIGLPLDDKTSVIRIMKAFKNRSLQLRYNTIDGIYASTSGSIHGSAKISKSDCKKMLHNWNDILEDLELMKIDDTMKQEITKEVVIQ
jgi:hypothetical protein